MPQYWSLDTTVVFSGDSIFHITNLLQQSVFSTPLQKGWKWNDTTKMWSTFEDSIDTSLPINPDLVKFSANELLSCMPEQFRRLNLVKNEDCGFLFATCSEPMRLIALHARLMAKTLHQTTIFDDIQQEGCLDVMLKLTKPEQTEVGYLYIEIIVITLQLNTWCIKEFLH